MNQRPASNFTLLETRFRSIIVDVREGDGSGQNSSMSSQRKTIVFNDRSRLLVTERIVKGAILYSYYDWIKSDAP
jgi:hypothetical protein